MALSYCKEGCIFSWLLSTGTLSGVKPEGDTCIVNEVKVALMGAMGEGPHVLPCPTTGSPWEILSTGGSLEATSPWFTRSVPLPGHIL